MRSSGAAPRVTLKSSERVSPRSELSFEHILIPFANMIVAAVRAASAAWEIYEGQIQESLNTSRASALAPGRSEMVGSRHT